MLKPLPQTTPAKRLSRYCHMAAAALFILMACIQLNDPDPLYWVITYSMSAFVAATNFARKRFAKLTHVTYGMILSGLLIALPGAIDYFAAGDFDSILGKMTDEKPYVESARELGGLLIIATYMVFPQRK